MKKTVLIVGILLAVGLGTAYFLNKLSAFGLCKPGMKFSKTLFMGNGGCYTPSGLEGKTCSKKSDCGTGLCVLEPEAQKGICEDIPRGCITVLDPENDIKAQEKEITKMMCID